jgi:uncharacterized protein YcfJ
MKTFKIYLAMVLLIASSLVLVACTQPVTKREQASLVGGGLGLATGAIIGGAAGHAAAGALIGGPIGLLAGAIIGDQLMAQDERSDRQEREIAATRADIERLRRKLEQLERERYEH